MEINERVLTKFMGSEQKFSFEKVNIVLEVMLNWCSWNPKEELIKVSVCLRQNFIIILKYLI